MTGLAWWVEIQQVFPDLMVLLSPQGHLEESRPWGIVCHPFPAGPSGTACGGQSRRLGASRTWASKCWVNSGMGWLAAEREDGT